MLVKKLGQPVPDSYFISEVYRGRPQPAQANTPARFSSLSALVPARSVPSSRSTRNASAGRRLRHSSFDSLSGSPGEGTVAPAGRKVFQSFCSSSMPFMLAGGAAYAAREAKALATKAFNKVRRVHGPLNDDDSRGRPVVVRLVVIVTIRRAHDVVRCVVVPAVPVRRRPAWGLGKRGRGNGKRGGGDSQFLHQHGNLLFGWPSHLTRSRSCREPTKCNICNSVLNFAPLGASNAADSHCLLYCVLRRGRVGAGGVPVKAADDGGAVSPRRRRRYRWKTAGGRDAPCAEAASRGRQPHRRRRRSRHGVRGEGRGRRL